MPKNVRQILTDFGESPIHLRSLAKKTTLGIGTCKYRLRPVGVDKPHLEKQGCQLHRYAKPLRKPAIQLTGPKSISTLIKLSLTENPQP